MPEFPQHRDGAQRRQDDCGGPCPPREELHPLEADAPSPSRRLGTVLSVRLDPVLAEALSREAERRSRLSGTTIGHTTLARQLIAEGLRPPTTRVTVELELGQDGRVRALPVTPDDHDAA